MTWDDVWSLAFIVLAGVVIACLLGGFRWLVDRLSKWLQEEE
jgi:hypothetical protein